MNAINFDRRLEDDYYYILGCHDSSSGEQILAEYKHRALLFHPDKTQDDSSKDSFQKLQEAKEVLCDPEKRKDYDKWKASGLTISFNQWSSMKGPTAVFHWATSKPVEKMLESSNPGEQQSKSQQYSYLHSRPAPPLSHNSVLYKFRNYEI